MFIASLASLPSFPQPQRGGIVQCNDLKGFHAAPLGLGKVLKEQSAIIMPSLRDFKVKLIHPHETGILILALRITAVMWKEV